MDEGSSVLQDTTTNRVQAFPHAAPSRQEAPVSSRTRWPRWAPPALVMRGFGLHILIPLLLAAGMALAYLGAFHQPSPSHLDVGVVGSSPQTQVLAQTLTDRSHGALIAHVVSDEGAARAQVRERSLAAVYAPSAHAAALFLSTAASPTTASVSTSIFSSIAYGERLPLKIVDVVPATGGDASGQGLFFLLVALSVGGYASAVVLAGAAAKLNLLWTGLLTVATSAAIAGLGVVVAGPIYGVIDAHSWLILLFAWWYVAVICTLGVALHPLLKHWTTPVLTGLFVMLNFTSSGGVFAPALQPALFVGLHSFWLGAAWLHAAQTLQYFWGQDIGPDAITMGAWSAVAVGLLLLVRAAVRRSAPLAVETPITEQDQAIAA
jgi:hypothetical protein